MSSRIVVLASGEGSTLQAIMETCNVVLVISNNRDSGALRRAQKLGISGVFVEESAQSDLAMLTALESSRTDLIVLAGYMRKVGPLTLAAYQGRIINTHPSLLPKFGGKGMYGRRVHKAVLDSGDTETGVTVHHVIDDYDKGDVIAQCVVPIMPGDTEMTIEERVKDVEKRLICGVIQNWHFSETN
jgi:phosphoribosylglycinamide formyltransferase-1